MQASGQPQRKVVCLWCWITGPTCDALTEGAAGANAIGQLTQQSGCEICAKG